MSWNAVDFVVRETALHLKRERLIAVTTISTIAVLMLVLGSLVLLVLDVRSLTHSISEALEVRAYFRRDVPRDKAEETARAIARWPEVKTVRFITREEGWQWLHRSVLGSQKLRGIDNPLSDGVAVYLKQPEMIAGVAAKLEALNGIKDVVPTASESRRTTGFWYKVIQVRRILTGAAIAISALVALAGIFIIHNTIRLALHARWREIYIMQLIGAGRGVIAAPFLLEGMVHGSLGAAFAASILLPVHVFLRARSAESVPFITLAPDSILLWFGLGVLAAGIVLGFTGSAFSVRRYLRKKPEWQT